LTSNGVLVDVVDGGGGDDDAPEPDEGAEARRAVKKRPREATRLNPATPAEHDMTQNHVRRRILVPLPRVQPYHAMFW
jgi:hypothetical protein